MNYEEALKYLDSFINYERRDNYNCDQSFKLDRVRRLAANLGNPQSNFKSIHIAGTKGKGSTSAIVYSILKEAGYRTGLYTSPHLISFRERIRINDELISEEDTSRMLTQIKKITDSMSADMPTFFEVYTVLSYLYFSEKKVDFAVFEVGLGGRLDATNILEPLVSAITPISYEHTDKLGNTLTAIAGEKAGIVKDDSICVVAPQEEEALSAIMKICRQRRTKVILTGSDVKFKEISFTPLKEIFEVKGLSGDYSNLEMALLGSHQVANAATAIGVVEALKFRNIEIGGEAIRRGVKNANWPGRLEVVSKEPLVMLDGAQNRASAKALAQAVKRTFEYDKLILVLGVSKDKDIKGILEELLPCADKIILTKSKVAERAADPKDINKLIPEGRELYVASGVKEAIAKAKAAADKKDLILITGSLFVVGEARQMIYG
ncbi:MAG: folylpolyglutamate synthase/dihydrofolate synthase family protein [Candidatus Omnitrophota bacterium]